MGMIPEEKGNVKQVNITMYDYQVKALDILSKERGLSRSHYLRAIIDLLIKQYEAKEEVERKAREITKETEEKIKERIGEDNEKGMGLKAYRKEVERD